MDKQRRASFMRRAIALSCDNVGSCGPFGAVIVCDGRVVAEGTNRVTATNDPTAHAEIVAIRVACAALGRFELRGCEIYTSCEPCPMCLAAIYWARLDRIFFGNDRKAAAQAGFDDEFLYHEVAVALQNRSIATTQLLADEAAVAFDAWLATPDRVPY
jgi:tRNA(Arg) A34 adenosine deaminase TadA